MYESPRIFDLFINFYGYYIPFILIAIWTPMALLDLIKRKIDPRTGIIWSIVILCLPLVGAGIYHIFGKNEIPEWFRYVFIYGGIGLLVIIMLLSTFLKY